MRHLTPANVGTNAPIHHAQNSFHHDDVFLNLMQGVKVKWIGFYIFNFSSDKTCNIKSLLFHWKCTKSRMRQCRISNFPGERPRTLFPRKGRDLGKGEGWRRTGECRKEKGMWKGRRGRADSMKIKVAFYHTWPPPLLISRSPYASAFVFANLNNFFTIPQFPYLQGALPTPDLLKGSVTWIFNIFWHQSL